MARSTRPGAENPLARLYFGKDDAESDFAAGGLLKHGFLRTAAYEAAMSGQKSLLIGRKGSGKSAICMMLSASSSSEKTFSVVTPDEISADELRRFELPGIAAHQSKALVWRYVFAIQVAKYLVIHAQQRRHEGQSDTVKRLRKFLVENDEVEDLTFQEKFWRVIERVKGSVSLEAFGFKASVDVEAPSSGIRASQMIDRLESYLSTAFEELGCNRTAHGEFVLLVDQIEKVWSGDPGSDAMVVGLLMATSHISRRFERVRSVVFIRTDIYELLQFPDRDKLRSEEMPIDWNRDALLDLVFVRARASLGHHPDLPAEELWGKLFPRQVSDHPTPDFIVSHTLMRPREAIQLCNKCAGTAQKNGHRAVLEDDVHEATAQYSTWKLADLIGEYAFSFPYLNELFVLFQNSGYMWTRSSLQARYETIRQSLMSHYPTSHRLASIDTMLDVLYGIGFLGTVRNDATVYVYEDPKPISPYDVNLVVHPTFREALRATTPTGVPSFASNLRPLPTFDSTQASQPSAGTEPYVSSGVFTEGGIPHPEGPAAEELYVRDKLLRLRSALAQTDLPPKVRSDINQELMLMIQTLDDAESAGTTNSIEYIQYELSPTMARYLSHTLDRLSSMKVFDSRSNRDLRRMLEDTISDLHETSRTTRFYRPWQR